MGPQHPVEGLTNNSHNTRMNPRCSPTPPKKKAKKKMRKNKNFFIKKNVKPIFLFDVELLIKIYVFNFFIIFIFN